MKKIGFLSLVMSLLVVSLISCTDAPGMGNSGASNTAIADALAQARASAADGYYDEAAILWMHAVANAESTETLSNDLIERLMKHDYLLAQINCFYLADELSPIDILGLCDAFCWAYYYMEFDDYQEAILAYPAQYLEPERIVILGEKTIAKLANDYFGLQHYKLDYNSPEVLEYHTFLIEEYPDYKDYVMQNNGFCYFPWDADPPQLIYKSSQSLGNKMFYIILEQGWYYDVDPVITGDLHLIIKENNSFFGYEVISVLQNHEISLIK
ncbi:MAG: hypothetical protein LBT43_00565 [Prevotella sp.]|nr:hypothetical protein [Prevotella sp.]